MYYFIVVQLFDTIAIICFSSCVINCNAIIQSGKNISFFFFD